MPKERGPRAANGVPWGDPKWGVIVDAAEMAELRRKREGVLGEDGVRRIRMSKTGGEWDDPRLELYENRGYTVEDKGRHYVLSIAQKEFERMEAERIAQTMAMSPKPKKNREFSLNSEDQLAPVSTQDLLTQGSGT
jgi:hypothetical protein